MRIPSSAARSAISRPRASRATVFPVRDQHDGFVRTGATVEQPQRVLQDAADVRAAAQVLLGVERLDEVPERDAVVRQGRHGTYVPGEGQERGAVVGEHAEQSLHRALGARQTVRLEVLHEHRTRRVEAEHKVEPPAPHVAQRVPAHRPEHGQHQTEDRSASEQHAQPRAVLREARQETLEVPRGDQGQTCPLARTERPQSHEHQQRQDEEEQRQLGAQQVEPEHADRPREAGRERHHGNLLAQVKADSHPTRYRRSPAAR